MSSFFCLLTEDGRERNSVLWVRQLSRKLGSDLGVTSHLIIRKGSTIVCFGPQRQPPFRISFSWRSSFSKTLEGRSGDRVDSKVKPELAVS